MIKPYQLFELLSLATGLITYRVIRPVYFNVITVLLFLTVVTEIIIVPYVKVNDIFNRNIIYNVFSFVDMLSWYYVFFIILKGYNIRKWVPILAVVSFSWTAIELSKPNSWNYIHPDSFRFYECSIIFLSLTYFYEILKKNFYPVFSDPNFWICSACIIYHSLLFLTFTTLLENNYWSLKDADTIFLAIHNFTNIFYYTLISFAFISCYYKNKLER